jgi:hypothetical protein
MSDEPRNCPGNAVTGYVDYLWVPGAGTANRSDNMGNRRARRPRWSTSALQAIIPPQGRDGPAWCTGAPCQQSAGSAVLVSTTTMRIGLHDRVDPATFVCAARGSHAAGNLRTHKSRVAGLVPLQTIAVLPSFSGRCWRHCSHRDQRRD